MPHTSEKADKRYPGWILFFYSVPSKPVSNRMRVWRKLIKSGAVQLKGAVYVLPFNDEHYELLQWLVSEITEMKGDAAFTRIEHIDTMKDSEIIALFDQQRANDYRAIVMSLDNIERRLSSMKQGGKTPNTKALSDQFRKLLKEFEEVRRIDFFSSREGRSLDERIHSVGSAISKLSCEGTEREGPVTIPSKAADNYQGKLWVTRKKPFVDRMASAWLIKKFIDDGASFDFIEEKDVNAMSRNSIGFDMRGGEFTHVGNLCTFEVLIRSFGLKDKTLRKMAEIVHEIDLKDDRYKPSESKGLEDILLGIRKTTRNDPDTLERGMQVFEMLYASKR